MILPASAKFQKVQQSLDWKRPDSNADKVQRLHDSVHRIAYRLESLGIAQNRIAEHSPKQPESIAGVVNRGGKSVKMIVES